MHPPSECHACPWGVQEELGTPALAFVRAVCDALRLDAAVEEEVAELRHNLLRLTHTREFAPAAAFKVRAAACVGSRGPLSMRPLEARLDGTSIYAQIPLHHDRLRPHAHLRQASGWPRAYPALPCACLEHAEREKRWSVRASTLYRTCQDSAAQRRSQLLSSCAGALPLLCAAGRYLHVLQSLHRPGPVQRPVPPGRAPVYLTR